MLQSMGKWSTFWDISLWMRGGLSRSDESRKWKIRDCHISLTKIIRTNEVVAISFILNYTEMIILYLNYDIFVIHNQEV